MADEAGGWVIDPKNPNRATYTDEDGQTHEIFKKTPVPTSDAPTAIQPAKTYGKDFVMAGDDKPFEGLGADYDKDYAAVVNNPNATKADFDALAQKYSPGATFQGVDEFLAAKKAGKAVDTTPRYTPDWAEYQKGPRGAGERLFDSMKESAIHGFGGLVARKWDDWSNTGRSALEAQFPGKSDEWYEQTLDQTRSMAERAIRADMERKQARDPNWRPDETFLQAVTAFDRWVPWLAGQVIGSVGPESLINPGSSAAARIGGQFLLGGASDAAYQAADIIDDVEDDFSVERMIGAAAAGAGFQGALEVPGFVRGLFKQRGVDTTPSATPEAQTPVTNAALPDQGELDLRPTVKREEVIQSTPEEAPVAPVERTKADLAREAGLVPEEPNTAVAAPEGNTEGVVDTPSPQAEAAMARVDELTADWKNAPEVEVFNDFSDIEGVDPSFLGFVGDDGKVRINASAAKDPATVDAILFHEALGHYGLAQKFGDSLDKLMNDLYDGNADIRSKADAYGQKFPDTYADADSPTARHVEEVLAEMSQNGQLSPTIRGQIARVVKEFLRSMGINIKISKGEIDTILGMAHDAVVKGVSVPENGFRFGSRPAQDIRPMQRLSRDDDEMTLIGAINPARIQSKHDIEEILEGLADDIPHETYTHEQAKADAEAMGMNLTKMRKGEGDVGKLTAKVFAARQFMTAQLNKVARLQEKFEAEGHSDALQADFIKALANLRVAHATVSNNASELGRALASLRMVSDGKMKASAVVKAMQEQGNDLLGDPEEFKKFMATLAQTTQTSGPAAAIKMAKQAFVPGAEKYIFSAWYNMLLSSPSTHIANFAGTGGNFMADLFFKSGAAVKGQFGRNADRIRAREIGYRVYGALSALKQATTWKNTREVLAAKAGASAGPKTEGNQHVLGGNAALDFASGVLEGPSRALAGADEFWRNVLQLSNIHGLAVRNAGNEGLTGKAFYDRVNDLISNPTKEMLDASADYTKVLQFQDRASEIGQALMKMQTARPDSTVPGRIARGVLKAAVPFVRTPDALIRTALRYTPLGAFERENVKGWKAGGAQRDEVKARMIMGSMLSFWLATQAYQENITGQGPSDFKKKQEWLASHQENSIKIGDTYYSIAGLEPVSTVINGIATLTERMKSGDISEGEYAKRAMSLAQGIASVLTENSYMEGLNSLLDINDKDVNQAELAGINFIAGLASSATTPAILRKYTQAQDTAVRDTTGDGSFYDRVVGRIKSGLPGLTDQLPQRYDVYGRAQERRVAGPDMASRTNYKPEENDPAIQALVSLANTTDKVVVGAPGKNIKVDGETRRLTAEEFQRYQHLSGYYIVEMVRAEMNTPEWQTGNDSYKRDAVKEIVEEARKGARQYLFDPEDEETEEEIEE